MSFLSTVGKIAGGLTLGAIPIIGPMLAMKALAPSQPAAPTTPPPPTDSFYQSPTSPMTLPPPVAYGSGITPPTEPSMVPPTDPSMVPPTDPSLVPPVDPNTTLANANP